MPAKLAKHPKVLWEVKLPHSSLGGIAATESFVVLGGRSLDDTQDTWRCYDALTGLELWTVKYKATGKLDYGNSPRATPLVSGERVFLFGAFGDLRCVNLFSGETVWKINIRKAFGAKAELPWGYCASPLLVDGKLIVNPGAKEASIVALSPKDGKVLWKTPGAASGYGSFIAARLGGVLQIVGHDKDSLGGWDPGNGKRLWRVKPPFKSDFNVPTPIAVDGKLLVATENNGTRLYRFKTGGIIDPTPVAINRRLNPDTSTPVVVGRFVYCTHKMLHCLDWSNGLKVVWKMRDGAVSKHGAIIASARRLLVIGNGELLLFKNTGKRPADVQRMKLESEKTMPYSHPGIVGSRMYIRSSNRLRCLSLSVGVEAK